ncbi:winged helix-turn-helix domain-containing protein [Saliphagus sp. LR7]|uniref:helix-turn-helix transcriptional regulator n=1 Tax=Saliphagus sp. LR7 TaxID=2282654 RepID=UPI000DF794EC|nr:HTH domain-containing protein [Saliphagus sp. LR7]
MGDTVGDQQAIEEIGFLANSASRVNMLELLREADSRRVAKATFRDRLDCSRTTIGRNLEALEERGFIERDHDDVALTRIGEVVAGDFFELVETVAATRALEPFLEWAPPGEFDPPLLWRLADATMIVATQANPYAPEDAHVELMEVTETHRFALPIVGERGMEASFEMLQTNDDVSVELIVGPEIAELFDSHPRYREKMQRVLRTGQVEVRRSDDEIPYFVGLYDETVHLSVVDEDGRPRALLETEDDDVYAWAEDRYRKYRQTADPLEQVMDPH